MLYATGSTAELSYVLAAQIAPSLVFTLIGGVVADRLRPQRVIVAANLMIALGEGSFGILVLAGHPVLWQMILLEMITGTGMAIFYPASQALLPRVVPGRAYAAGQRAEPDRDERAARWAAPSPPASASPRSAPGWALAACGIGMIGTIPPLLRISTVAIQRAHHSGMLTRPAGGLVGVPVAYLALGDRGAVRRHPDGLVRRVPGARAGGGQDPPGRPSRLGRHHGRGVSRPDRWRPGVAAVHAAAADAVRRADRRGDRGLAVVAGACSGRCP